MKNFVKTLLVIIFIPVFTIAVVLASIKFQLLSPQFWKSSLLQHNVYNALSQMTKTMAASKTVKGGGNPQDIKILTDIATPELIKDFMERNITNILDYANGKRPDLMAYIPISKVPISKIPKNLAPKSVGLNSEELPLTSLMSKFNISQDSLPLSQIVIVGKTATNLLATASILSVIILIALFVLSEKGSNFISIGLTFIFSGLVVEIIVRILNIISMNLIKTPSGDLNFGASILAIVGPVILTELLKLWGLIGAIMIGIGIVVLFLKKPIHNLDRV